MGKRRRGDSKLSGDGDANPSAVEERAVEEIAAASVAMAPGALLPDVDMAEAAAKDGGGDGGGGENGTISKPAGMQIYWNLSAVDMAVREAAVMALVHELRAAQASFVANGGQGGAAEVLGAKENADVHLEGCAPSVQYALRRLVRGLGSSRESARQGFAAALAAVVGALPVLRGDALLRIITSNLEVTSSMKKQDARDGLLGRLFAYGALIRAQGVIGSGTTPDEKELAVEVVQQLFTLAKRKTFLQEPAVNLVIELAKRLPSSAVGETVCAAPLFDEWLRRDFENQCPEALLLVLELHGKLPAPVLQGCSLLPESGHLQDLFQPSHLAKLVPCLKESSSSHPRVHSVWTALLDRLLPQGALEVPITQVQESAKKKRAKLSGGKDAKDMKKLEANLTNFWSVVVDGALLPSSHERKHLAMELLLLILPRLPTAASVHIVLSNVFVRCILDILSAKDALLHKFAQRCLGELRAWAECDDARRVAIIVALQKNSHGKFDTLSKSSTVKTLSAGLTSEASVIAFVETLKELFQIVQPNTAKSTMKAGSLEEEGQGDDDEPPSEKEKSGDSDRIWIIEQMCALCRQVKLESPVAHVTLYKEVITFLTLHSLFDTSKPQKEASGLPRLPVSDNVRRLVTERLRSTLVEAEHWVFTQKLKNSNKSAIGSAGDAAAENPASDHEDFALFSAQCCENVQKSPAATFVKPLKEEDAETTKILQQTMASLSISVKTATNVEQTRKLVAIRALLSHLLLESLLEPGSSNDIAAELIICCGKAFPEFPELATIVTPVEEDEDEEGEGAPPVMDVLLDVLLSLLAKSSAPIRAAAEQVFKVFCGDLTKAGMADVLRIVNKGSKAARHKSLIEPGEGEDSEDDDDDDDILEEDDVEDKNGVDEGRDEGKGAKEEADEEDDEDEEDENDDEEDEEMEDNNNATKSGGIKLESSFNSAALQTGPGEDDDKAEGSDSDVSDMDDEAMFRADVLLANMLKQRKEVGSKVTQTQLAHFKFRVLSLLEYFLQKHPGSPLVLVAVQGLLKAFVNAVNQLGSAADENESLVKRLESLVQNKVVKVKKYPRGGDVDLDVARTLLQRSWKLASRSTIKRVRTLAQGCCLWALKVILGNKPDAEVKGDADVTQFLAGALTEFFLHKKSRLPSPFFAEILQRHPGLGSSCLGQLLMKCGDARTEFLKCEAMRLVSGILRPVAAAGKGKKPAPKAAAAAGRLSVAHALDEHLALLSSTLLSTVQKPPEKAAHKLSALQFASSCVDALVALYPQKPLSLMLDTGALVAGLKAVDVPAQGKLLNCVARLVKALAADAARIPPSNGKPNDAAAQKPKSPSGKKKKAADVDVEAESTPGVAMDVESTPRPKKKKLKDGTPQPKSGSKPKRPKVDS